MFRMFLKYSFVTGAVFMTTWDNICYFSRVDGPSMQPLINSSDKKNFVFIVRPLSLANILGQPPMENILKRGDVVSVVSPRNPKECFLKRVIGLPGDLVKTIHYKKKYVLVPQGHCWIEGDNFRKSYDSNAFGCVPMGLVLGQAKLIIFPSISPIKSDLPKHRRLKKLANSHDHNYLIDFKTECEDEEDDQDDQLDEFDDDDDDQDEDI